MYIFICCRVFVKNTFLLEGGVQIADPEEDTGMNIQENPEVPTTSVNAECTSSGYTQQHAEMVLF